MPLMTNDERGFAEAVSELVYCNPFLPERMVLERRALGGAGGCEEGGNGGPGVWSRGESEAGERPEVQALAQRSADLAEAVRGRLADGQAAGERELRLYADVALYLLYDQTRSAMYDAIERAASGSDDAEQLAARPWKAFRARFDHLLHPGGRDVTAEHRPEHVFACFFQIRRAFTHIFMHLVGTSAPAAALRAAIWQSIFTHDFRRYYATLHRRMPDFTTLIVGHSGTGKELVARAIGLSGFIPFDARRGRFAQDFAGAFFPVNLSALSPTLIESELFGHRRGSFTGAVEDRAGYLESCPPLGAVFLDEVGELAGAVQVKLLRVLQAREFARLGETQPRRFAGKLIAATHRDLAREVAEGRFRADFYYRLCSDVVRTPSLAEQLADRPGDLPRLVGFVTRQLSDDPAHAAELTDAVVRHIQRELGEGYDWPGNFRELEQCVRSVAIRGRYEPLERRGEDALDAALRETSCDADTLVARYARLVHRREGSYAAAARVLGLDRRTVKARVEKGSV